MGFATLITFFLAFRLVSLPVLAIPTPQAGTSPVAGTYWLADIERKGAPAFSAAGYQVFRNVKEFGAADDGVQDDTEFINAAITAGNRCGQGCDSSTRHRLLPCGFAGKL